MYRKELQRVCPRSQAWLVQAFEAAATTATTTMTAATTATGRRRYATARDARQQSARPAGLRQQQRGDQVQAQSQVQAQRLFSTTRARPEDTAAAKSGDAAAEADAEADAETDTATAESTETIVRQAKATFGDTLPKDYLSADEMRVYQRLYGAPIRETHPADVGIPRADEEFPYRDVVAEKQNALFRETPHGYLEQVEYAYTREEEAQMMAEFEGQFDPPVEGEEQQDVAPAAEEYEYKYESTKEAGTVAEAEMEPYSPPVPEPTPVQMTKSAATSAEPTTPEILTETQIDYIQAVAKNKRELAALMKLQRDFETSSRAAALAEAEASKAVDMEDEEAYDEEMEQAEEEEEEDEEIRQDTLADPQYRPRLHPLSQQGIGRPSPSTVNIPKHDVVAPITELLRRTDISHVRQAAENVFGGYGLPYSAHTPKPKAGKRGTGGNQNFEQRPVALAATQRRMTPIEADVYLATVYPTTYATALSTLAEVRKRLGPRWIQGLLERSKRGDGSLRVLDMGGGGAALAAWNQVFRAEVELLRERGVLPRRAQLQDEYDEGAAAAEGDEKDDMHANPPVEEEDTLVKANKKTDKAGSTGRFLVEKTVVVGNEELSFRASQFLSNTTFLTRLPDLLHSAENVARHLDGPATPHPTMPKRKTYDVILATHQVMGVDRPHQRRAMVDNLWAHLNPNGGVLILVEKGHPRGFEAVAYARQRLLDEFIIPPPQSKEAAMDPHSSVPEETPTDASEAAAAVAAAREAAGIYTSRRGPGMIVAPCTNHQKCPMYLRPGLTAGRKDFCHFSQRYIRPPFLQKIMGQSHRNHEDIQFSYVAVQRGVSPHAETDVMEDVFAAAMGQAAPPPPPRVMPLVQGADATDAAFAGYLGAGGASGETGTGTGTAPPPTDTPHMLTLPRVYMAPIKRRGHVILDVCTPEGKLERWTVPRSFGKQAYHDARKASWGDLWALGGKTRIKRTPRLGKDKLEERNALRDESELQDEDDADEAEVMRLTKAALVLKQRSTDSLLEHMNKNTPKAAAESAKMRAKKNKKKWDRQFKGYKGYKKQKQSRQAAAETILKALSKQDGFE